MAGQHVGQAFRIKFRHHSDDRRVGRPSMHDGRSLTCTENTREVCRSEPSLWMTLMKSTDLQSNWVSRR